MQGVPELPARVGEIGHSATFPGVHQLRPAAAGQPPASQPPYTTTSTRPPPAPCRSLLSSRGVDWFLTRLCACSSSNAHRPTASSIMCIASSTRGTSPPSRHTPLCRQVMCREGGLVPRVDEAMHMIELAVGLCALLLEQAHSLVKNPSTPRGERRERHGAGGHREGCATSERDVGVAFLCASNAPNPASASANRSAEVRASTAAPSRRVRLPISSTALMKISSTTAPLMPYFH